MKIRRLSIQSFSIAGVLLSSLLINVSHVVAQDEKFANFDQIDLIVAQDISRFSKLFAEGQKRVVRLALLGDSQETALGGGERV